MKKILCFFLILLFTNCYAVPSQVVVIRHSDKIYRVGKETGPALSPTGYLRAVKFALYYFKNFGEPDMIIASNPNIGTDHVASIREIQTIAPLANLLQQQHQELRYQIFDPYPTEETPALGERLMQEAKYNHKKILICWEHHRIPLLLKHLGLQIPQPKWPDDDFDSVYVLNYDANGKLINYQLLHDQYPVQHVDSWQAIADKFSSSAATQNQR